MTTRVKDGFKEFAGQPSGDSGEVMGAAPQETATATTGTAAATGTGKTDKDGIKPAQGSNEGLTSGGQSTTYVQFPSGDAYVPVYYLSEGAADIKYSTNNVVLKNIYWQTTGSDVNYIANATYGSGEPSDGFEKGALLWLHYHVCFCLLIHIPSSLRRPTYTHT